MSRARQLRHHLEELGCRVLAWTVQRLSRGACVKLANALGSLAYMLDARGRAVALANLKCVFGDRLTASQRIRIARGSYRNFLRTMLDLFWAQRMRDDTFRRWMDVEGWGELSAELQRQKRGTVWMCVHQGNWEWANLCGGFVGTRTTVVAETFKNPRLTALFQRLRELSGNKIIPQENSILRLFKVAGRGGTTGMLVDLNLPPTQAATVIDAFGMKMCVPLLHAALADRVNALLVPIETQPQPDGTCRIIVHRPVDFPAGATLQEIAQRCWNVFEPIIRARPEEYLWAYKHFRYKPRGAQREYPFYANESGKFEKLLKRSTAAASPGAPAAG